MTTSTEMKILNLYKGQTLKKARYALDIAKAHIAHRELALRVKLVNLTIGE